METFELQFRSTTKILKASVSQHDDFQSVLRVEPPTQLSSMLQGILLLFICRKPNLYSQIVFGIKIIFCKSPISYDFLLNNLQRVFCV